MTWQLCCRFINDMVDKYKKPVWIAEFACPNSGGPLNAQIAYMRSALKVLDEDDNVEMCAADCLKFALIHIVWKPCLLLQRLAAGNFSESLNLRDVWQCKPHVVL